MKKRREYGQRVRDVEHGSFTPLVCTTDGGMAPEATVFLKDLAAFLPNREMRRTQQPLAGCVL